MNPSGASSTPTRVSACTRPLSTSNSTSCRWPGSAISCSAIGARSPIPLLRGPQFSELTANLPGYRAQSAGILIDMAEAFPWLKRLPDAERRRRVRR